MLSLLFMAYINEAWQTRGTDKHSYSISMYVIVHGICTRFWFILPIFVALSVFRHLRDWYTHILYCYSLRWRHNGRDSVSNHQPHHCLLNRLFRHRSKETSKLRVTGLCVGNSPGTGEFPAQRASNAENVSIWWRHHVKGWFGSYTGAKMTLIEWGAPNTLLKIFKGTVTIF